MFVVINSPVNWCSWIVLVLIISIFHAGIGICSLWIIQITKDMFKLCMGCSLESVTNLNFIFKGRVPFWNVRRKRGLLLSLNQAHSLSKNCQNGFFLRGSWVQANHFPILIKASHRCTHGFSVLWVKSFLPYLGSGIFLVFFLLLSLALREVNIRSF